ncbi:hypothetical protein XELAEV_18003991mg [Xenopus laevis]|uniref:Uncharacterized protein n=1 Tax=Xenopus laevis TaxID=8355 RepID=A0A974BS54_XENLA|nr:hypothetical protein XELAEV_18003991mg [Xenopus laevis]
MLQSCLMNTNRMGIERSGDCAKVGRKRRFSRIGGGHMAKYKKFPRQSLLFHHMSSQQRLPNATITPTKASKGYRKKREHATLQMH